MTDRKRLIKILENAPTDPDGNRNVEVIANHLLANGVLAPPCKVGDRLWWYNVDEDLLDDLAIGVHEEPCGVQALVWDGEKWGALIDGDVVPIGTQYAMLSREVAEKELNKFLEENNV